MSRGRVAMLVFVLAVAVHLVAALLLWAQRPADEHANVARVRHLRISYNPYLTNAPLFVARDEGYFAEAGIDVEFITLDSDAEPATP